MKSKIDVLVLFILCMMHVAVAQVDTIKRTDTLQQKPVLIAKGNSYLENAVAKIVADSLKSQGVTVLCVDVKKLEKENAGDFKTIIVFSAIKSSGVVEPFVKKFIFSKGNTVASNILVCTVYGEKWHGSPAREDAVSAATKTLNPGKVSQKILEKIARSKMAY